LTALILYKVHNVWNSKIFAVTFTCLLTKCKNGTLYCTFYSLKSTIFWDTMPCSPLKVIRRFGEKLPPSSRSKNKQNNKLSWKRGSLFATFFQGGFLLGSCFKPEDGSDKFLRHVIWFSTDYTALYSIR
jgi:hypothetical protein